MKINDWHQRQRESTLARRIASQLNIPYIEMDLLYWRPNWQGTPKEDSMPDLTQALSQPDWVLDGNYDRSRDIKWRDVDVVVWVDYGFWHTLRPVTLRAIARARSRQELWPETGNRESLRRAFLSRDSIIFWMLKTGAVIASVTGSIWSIPAISICALFALAHRSRQTNFSPRCPELRVSPFSLMVTTSFDNRR